MTDADGQVLAGRYRLTELLGRGGMGMVWRAHDEQLGRDVAVKELRLPEQLDDAGRQTWMARLDREARAAARLRHPGIVTVHDRVIGEDGRPWIVMELVRGRSLGDLLAAEGPLPPGRVAQIGLQMLEALNAAHRAGITHRDIKPANVLLEEDRVVLTDFGIAAVEGDATLTATGAVLGTPAFTLYTAVEGRPPFEGAGAGAVFIAIATQDPAPPVHAGFLEPVLRTLMLRDPAQRPTADHLHAQLTSLAQSRPPAPSTAVQRPVPLPRPARSRKRKVVGLILASAATVLALILVAAGAAFVDDRQQKAREKQEDARYEANRETVERMTSIPGKLVTLRRSSDEGGKAYAESELCDDATFSNNGCDVDSMVTAVINWLRAQPSVRSATLNDPRSECDENPGCSFTVLTKGAPKISKVSIYTQYLSEPTSSIVLGFKVG
ncbi:serine/threonine-protein kinase [Spirillospora sp. CA-128828]|uniref:serine/threonine-protein kinase n=1 Tax=Spirillospora sp. CA-128828 TaxID=3240033 RepID=UPI003D8C185F